MQRKLKVSLYLTSTLGAGEAYVLLFVNRVLCCCKLAYSLHLRQMEQKKMKFLLRSVHIRLRKIVAMNEDLSKKLDKLDKQGVNTQQVRISTVNQMKNLFDLATTLAHDAEQPPKFRQEWGRLAAYCAQVMISFLQGLDDTNLDMQYEELKIQLEQVKTLKATGRAKEAVNGTQSSATT
jgi:hypothetical protein